MTVSVNHTDHADERGIRLVVHGVWISIEQRAAEKAAYDEMLLRRSRDAEQGVIKRIEKAERGHV